MVQNVGGFVKNNEMKGLGAGFAGWGNNGLVNTFVNVMQDNIIGLVLGFLVILALKALHHRIHLLINGKPMLL